MTCNRYTVETSNANVLRCFVTTFDKIWRICYS